MEVDIKFDSEEDIPIEGNKIEGTSELIARLLEDIILHFLKTKKNKRNSPNNEKEDI